MAISKAERAAVFAMFDGHCAYCGCVLPLKGWQVDHVEPVRRQSAYVINTEKGYGEMRSTGKCDHPDRDHVGNMMPSCRPCNIEKGCESVEGFRRGIERKIEVLRNNSSAFRHAERFSLVVVMGHKVVFYFEQIALTQKREETRCE